MSIHDDEIEYQQWREEKEDWEMMLEYRQNCDRVEKAIADIAENIQAMESKEFKDCLCQVDIIGLIREKFHALQFEEDRVGLLQAEVAGLKQGISKHNAQVAALNDTIIDLRSWKAESDQAHQQEIGGLKAKISDYIAVRDSTATRHVAEVTKWQAAFKTLRKMIQDAPELNMGNCTDDQVAELNHAVCQMACFCDEVAKS